MSEVLATRMFGFARDASALREMRRVLGRVVLAVADLSAFGLTLLAGYLSLRLQGTEIPGEALLILGIGMAVTLLVAGTLHGLHDPAGLDPLERFRMRVMVSLWMPWPALGLFALHGPATTETLLLVAFSAIVFLPVSMLLEAALTPLLVARSAWGADVVVIGLGEDVARVTGELLTQPEIGLRPVGYLGDAPELGPAVAVPRLGSIGDVPTLGHACDVAVIIASPSLRDLDLSALPFSRIVIVPEFAELPVVSMQTRALGRRAGFTFANPARARSSQFAKRAVDLVIAVPALIFAAPVILLTALLIKCIDRGPAFYTQPRVGWRGEMVGILKLRSMYTDAAERLVVLLRQDPEARLEWDTYVKLTHDPRILPIIGNFIRRTSIDELPQLWNVVRGDISLVGPRPFPEYHVAKFSPEFQALRCAVRPGLTGLWQVSDRSGADLRQQETIDTFYIRNWSLWLDLFIVLRTLPAVIAARGAR